MGSVAAGIWSVILAVNCLWTIPSAQMWFRRHLEPIRSRRPALLMSSVCMIVLFDLWTCAVPIVRQQITVAVYGIVTGCLLVTAMEMFTFFCFSLYVAYRRTTIQVKVGSDSPGTATRTTRRWITISTWVLKDRVALLWVAVQVLVVFVIQVVYLSNYPHLWQMPYSDGQRDPTAAMFLNIAFFRCIVTMLVAVVVTGLLRGVSDAFGTVDMLKKVGLAGLAGLSGLVGVTLLTTASEVHASVSTLDLPSIIAILASNVALWLMLGRPLLDTYKALPEAEIPHMSRLERNLNAFRQFLETLEGFAAFKAHLQTEFAVESLLFWAAARKFKREFTKGTGAVAARSIYDGFLAPDAPLQINLPGESFRHFRSVFVEADVAGQDDYVHASMFDAAAEQMLALMQVNSLARFKSSNKGCRVWAKFAENIVPMQMAVPDTMSGDIMRQAGFVTPGPTATLQHPAAIQVNPWVNPNARQ
ncbi:RGS domain-containing protein [Plasmodiophora brassicae]|uniref:RGS domain-containing protein n=1 Tax=Plasmodiophora brassicae TaxID=37360 RepID=A0A0G4IUI7_PLABS|nr:hypothetical protein PBRA_007016 [Plasmodiophora brassicae]SPQ92975.1 unnamed protein product [Plasmodiophora brassicae]